MSDYKALFDEIYSTKRGGYGSGGGSSAEQSESYERLVERMLDTYHPLTVLDLGCGDGQVASRINWREAHYIGMDVTSEALKYHSRHSVKGGEIIHGDMLHDILPSADLVLTREATQHMATADIHLLIERLRAMRYPRVLHTSCIEGEINSDIEPGQTRTVDLSQPPFSLLVTTMLRSERFISQLWEPATQF